MTATANPETIDFQHAQASYHDNAEARRAATNDLESALYDKAKHEHDYRKALSVAYTKHRLTKGAGEAEIHAKADSASFALQRDMADAASKAASARLAELEGERATLRQLVDWSMKV